MPDQDPLPLSPDEAAQVKRIAKRDGISDEEAATMLVQAALARRVRKRTGKAPARVYAMRKGA